MSFPIFRLDELQITCQKYYFYIRMKKAALILILIASMGLSSCSLFKKKCNCPDVRRQKRVALLSDKAHFELI
jgi:hypothetical protein